MHSRLFPMSRAALALLALLNLAGCSSSAGNSNLHVLLRGASHNNAMSFQEARWSTDHGRFTVVAYDWRPLEKEGENGKNPPQSRWLVVTGDGPDYFTSKTYRVELVVEPTLLHLPAQTTPRPMRFACNARLLGNASGKSRSFTFNGLELAAAHNPAMIVRLQGDVHAIESTPQEMGQSLDNVGALAAE